MDGLNLVNNIYIPSHLPIPSAQPISKSPLHTLTQPTSPLTPLPLLPSNQIPSSMPYIPNKLLYVR